MNRLTIVHIYNVLSRPLTVLLSLDFIDFKNVVKSAVFRNVSPNLVASLKMYLMPFSSC